MPCGGHPNGPRCSPASFPDLWASSLVLVGHCRYPDLEIGGAKRQRLLRSGIGGKACPAWRYLCRRASLDAAANSELVDDQMAGVRPGGLCFARLSQFESLLF